MVEAFPLDDERVVVVFGSAASVCERDQFDAWFELDGDTPARRTTDQLPAQPASPEAAPVTPPSPRKARAAKPATSAKAAKAEAAATSPDGRSRWTPAKRAGRELWDQGERSSAVLADKTGVTQAAVYIWLKQWKEESETPSAGRRSIPREPAKVSGSPSWFCVECCRDVRGPACPGCRAERPAHLAGATAGNGAAHG